MVERCGFRVFSIVPIRESGLPSEFLNRAQRPDLSKQTYYVVGLFSYSNERIRMQYCEHLTCISLYDVSLKEAYRLFPKYLCRPDYRKRKRGVSVVFYLYEAFPLYVRSIPAVHPFASETSYKSSVRHSLRSWILLRNRAISLLLLNKIKERFNLIARRTYFSILIFRGEEAIRSRSNV